MSTPLRTVLMLLLLTCRQADAQQVFFTENFDAMTPPSIRIPWANDFSFMPWQVGEPYQLGLYGCFDLPGNNGRNKVAAVTDCNAMFNPDNSNVLLKTPFIDLTGTGAAFLRYESFFVHRITGSQYERATLEVSADSGTTWTVLDTVAGNADLYHFQTRYADLSAYAGRRIRIGFRYSDGAAASNMPGWAIDSVKVYKPAQKDISTIRLYPEEKLMSYVAELHSIPVRGVVQNAGIDTITSFVLKYQDGAGPVQSDTIRGIRLASFDTLSFVHRIPFTMPDMGQHTLKVWAEIAGDGNTANDSRYVTLYGAAFLPKKVLAIEQNTGTWNRMGPLGIVAFDQLLNTDHDVNLFMIHGADPMDYHLYDNWMYYLQPNSFNYQPMIFIDRRERVNPARLAGLFRQQADYFGFADLDVRVSYLNRYNMGVEVKVRPAVALSGDYRVAVVVTENEVTGRDSSWNQRNFYQNSGVPMGGFENQPDPVPFTRMTYNYVARKIAPQPDGGPNTLPARMSARDTLNTTISIPLDSSWSGSNYYVTALLINARDSSILNSKRIRTMSLEVPRLSAGGLQATVYPNPASDQAHLTLRLDRHLQVGFILSDMTGRTVWQQAGKPMNAGTCTQTIPTGQLRDGIYLLTLQSGDTRQTLKVAVIH